MANCPETYTFILNSEYQKVRSWAQGKILPDQLGAAKPYVIDNAATVKAWVQHNEANRKTLPPDDPRVKQFNRPSIAYLEFLEQYDLAQEAKRRFKN